MSKITEKYGQEIIDKFVKGLSRTELANQYHVTRKTIGNILNGICCRGCNRPNNIHDLIYNERKIRSGRKCKSLLPFTELQSNILIGSLLGDGMLHKIANRCNSRFSKSQMCSKKEYVDWHFEILSDYSKLVYPMLSKDKISTNKDGTLKRTIVPARLVGYRFNTVSHPNFTLLRHKWYPEEIKAIPLDLELNPQIIAIWFFDDGYNNVKQRYATIATESFTMEEAEFLCSKLNYLDLFPKIEIRKSRYTDADQPILRFFSNSYDKLIFMIKPYVLWDCFAYKTKWRPAKTHWQTKRCKFTEEQIREVRELKKVKSAKEIAQQFNVDDTTIYSIISRRSWKYLI